MPITTTLDWQQTSEGFWSAGHSRIYRVNSSLYLASANEQWLQATFVSWAKAADAVQLTLECQPPAPDAEEQPMPSLSRNYVVPGCAVDISSDEPQPVGKLLSLVFAIARSNPTAEIGYSLNIRES